MTFTYDQVAKKYLELRDKIDDIEAEAKRKKADLKAQMSIIEGWFLAEASKHGLRDIPTQHGTVYWARHHSAKVENRDDFLQYVEAHKAWDLLEVRASKPAVKSFISAHNTPPPGITFSTVQVFNLRATSSKESENE
jgi:hypothetical protein